MRTRPIKTSDWIAEHTATTNWGPWPITDVDGYQLFSADHAQVLAWAGTRGIDPTLTPVDAHPTYGTDEQGRRTVTLAQFVVDEQGRRVVLPDGSGLQKTTITVLDQPTEAPQ